MEACRKILLVTEPNQWTHSTNSTKEITVPVSLTLVGGGIPQAD